MYACICVYLHVYVYLLYSCMCVSARFVRTCAGVCVRVRGCE